MVDAWVLGSNFFFLNFTTFIWSEKKVKNDEIMDTSKIEKFLTTYDLIQNSYARDLKKKKIKKTFYFVVIFFFYDVFLTFEVINHTFFLSWSCMQK